MNKKTGAGGEVYDDNYMNNSKPSYSMDVVDKITQMLSDELAKNIDREILRGMGLILDKNKRRMDHINKIFTSKYSK